MDLRNDFFVASTHAGIHQTIGQFIKMAGSLSELENVKSALSSGPSTLVQDRNFMQIVLDDVMKSIVIVMGNAIETGAVSYDDLPNEFFLKMQKDRFGNQVKREESEAELRERIEDYLTSPTARRGGRNDVPDFIHLLAGELEPKMLAQIANSWMATMRQLGLLMMNEEALAARNAIEDVNANILGFVQPIINQDQQNKKALQGEEAGGKEGDDSVKIHKVEDMDSLEIEMGRLIGMNEAKELIREIEARVRHNNILQETGQQSDKDGGGIEHFVFTGNPGTGKTTFARLIGKIYQQHGLLDSGHVVEADSGDLVAGYVGQTALKTKKVIDKALDGVLFVDEAYLLDNELNKFGAEAMGTLLKSMEMNKERLVVVIAGYPEPMEKLIKSNPGLSRRFKYHMNFPDFPISDLMGIFDLNMKRHHREITPEARAMAEAMLVQNKTAMGQHFGNAGTVENLVDLLKNKLSKTLEDTGVLDEYEAAKALKDDKGNPIPVPQELKDKLVTITPEIVQQVKIGAPKAGGRASGYTPSSLGGEFEEIGDEAPKAITITTPGAGGPSL